MVLQFSKYLSLLCCCLLFGVTAATANVQYVSTTGDDTSGDGSSGNPWATIQHAIDVATADDTIIVAAGTYSENVTLTKTVDLRGANVGTAGAGSRGTESVIDGYVRVNAAADGSIIDGFSHVGAAILGQNAAIYIVADADDVTVRNNLFRRTSSHSTYRGVITETATSGTSIDNLLVQDNLFDDGVSPSSGNGWATGVYFNPYGNGTVESNTFSGNNVGISVDGPNGDTITISNNVFASSEYEALGIGPNGAVAVMGNDFQGSNTTYIGSYGSNVDLDATSNTFNGTVGSSLTVSEGFAVEDKIGHSVDAPGSGYAGFVRVRSGQVYVTPNSGSVQRGVNAADASDSVLVDAGTYAENVTLTKTIAMFGANAGTAGAGSRGTESEIGGYTRVNAVADGSSIDGFSIAGGVLVGQNAGVYLVADADDVTVRNNLFRRTSAHGAYRGVITEIANALTSVDNLVVENNLFDDGVSPSSGNGWATGVYFNPYGNGTVESNTFSGNNVGISVDGPNGDTITISNNVFASSEYEALGIGPNGAVAVMGNDFQGSNTTYIGSYGSNVDLDATSNTFNGTVGSSLTASEGFAVEDKIGHSVDAPGSGYAGFVRVRSGQVYVTPNSGSLQRGIDAADAGDVVEVQGGAYGRQSAANRFLFNGAGPYKFGLFINKDDLTIRGYGAGDVLVADPADVAVTFTTNATNSFGFSGTFIEADNVVISGLGFGDNFNDSDVMSPDNSWKVLEITGENTTLAYNRIQTTAAVFFNDMRFDDTLNNQSFISAFTITDNLFEDASKISFNNGTGFGHADSLRVVTGNTFDMNASTVETDVALWFAGADTLGYLDQPVGGAVVENNTFMNGVRRYVLTSGLYDTNQIDLQGIWNANTFDRKTVSLTDDSLFVVRSYSQSPFSNVRQIGASVGYELATVAADGDVVLAGAGTYPDEVMNLDVDATIRGENPADRPVLVGLVRNVGNLALSDVRFEDVVLQNDDAILEFNTGSTLDGVVFTNVDFDFNGTATPVTPANYRAMLSLPTVTISGNGLTFDGVTMGISTDSIPMMSNFFAYFWFQATGGPVLYDGLDLSGVVYDGATLVGAQLNMGTGATGVTIRNSTIHDGGNFYLSGIDSLEVYNNTFSESGFAMSGVSNADVHHNDFSDIYPPGHANGLVAGGTQNRAIVLKKAFGEENGNVNVSIRNNAFENVNISAVLVDQYTSADPDSATFNNVSVADNSFVNTPVAVENTYSTVTIPAECNWYGADSVAVVIAATVGQVDFLPYRVQGGNLASIGFDPDSAATCGGLGPVVVKRDSTIIDSYLGIQLALNASVTLAGDSLLISNIGMPYEENVLLSKDVVLVSSSASICESCSFIFNDPGIDTDNFVGWGAGSFGSIALTTNGSPAGAVAVADTGATISLLTSGLPYSGPIVLTKELTLEGATSVDSSCDGVSTHIIDGGAGAAVQAVGSGTKVIRNVQLRASTGGEFGEIASGSSGDVVFEDVQFLYNGTRIYGIQSLTSPSALADGNDIPEYLTNSGSGSFVYGTRSPFAAADLVAGWKAEDGNASLVQTLYDYSASAVNLTQSSISRRPTKISNGIDSRDALSIPSFGTRVLTANTTDDISGGQQKTVFVVFTLPSSGSSADKVIYKQGNHQNGISVVFDNSENIELNIYDGSELATFEVAISGSDLGKTYIAQIYFDSSSTDRRVGFALDNQDGTHWEDTVDASGFNVTSLSAPSINASSSISLGGRYGAVYADGVSFTSIGYGNSFNGGKIGEAMVLNTASKSVRDQVYCYLHAKYGAGDTVNALERIVAGESFEEDAVVESPVAVYPNPVDDRAVVRVIAPDQGRFTVELFNTRGEQLLQLFDGMMERGESIEPMLDATELENGVYMVVVTGGAFRTVLPVTILR